MTKIIGRKIVGARHNLCYVASDNTLKPMDVLVMIRAEQTRKLYAKQRVLCGSIQKQWQKEGLAK